MMLILFYFTCCKCDFPKIHGNYFPIWLVHPVIKIISLTKHRVWNMYLTICSQIFVNIVHNLNVRLQQVRFYFLTRKNRWTPNSSTISAEFWPEKQLKSTLWNCIISLQLQYVPTFIIGFLYPFILKYLSEF